MGYDAEKDIDYVLLPKYDRGRIIFGSNFRNGDFDGFTRFEVS